ncbi:MAG: hypothetical protein ACLR8P_12670 [Clostridium fessum]
MTLRAVLSQQLVPRAGGQGRAAACELMMLTPAIRNPDPRWKNTADAELSAF